MLVNKSYIKSTLVGVLTLSLGMNQSANALLVNPTAPIFLGGNIQPNIMFAVDDSGSMDWERLIPSDVIDLHVKNQDPVATTGNLDISPNNAREDREFCAAYNVLAYNPAVTYTPWIGQDDAGIAFGNADIRAARDNPYLSSSRSRNLLNAGGTNKAMIFGNWVDADGDGLYDIGECPTTAPDRRFNQRNHTNDTRFVSVANLGTAPDPNYVNPRTGMSHSQQTNFANWYQYYRKRDYVLKRAMTEIIDDTTARMGLATLWNRSGVDTPVRDMTIASDKQTLLNNTLRITPGSITPLRALLDNVGQYFDQNTATPAGLGFTDASPILPRVDGGECQQNFTVLMSDGFYNGAFTGLGNIDGGALRTISVDTDNDPSTPNEVVQLNGGPHADIYSDTLADIAMEYYSKDLSTLGNKVPIIASGPNEDKNNQQHMVTYTVAFGLEGVLNLSDVPADHDPLTKPPLDMPPAGSPPGTPPPGWPLPQGTAPDFNTADDMVHAAYNARGQYLSASNPQQLITSLMSAVGNIENRTASSASTVEFDSGSISSNTRAYAAGFNPQDFTGNVRAFGFDANGNFLRDAAGNPIELWDARNEITPTTRGNLYTLVNKSGVDTAIDFALGDVDLVTSVERPAGAGPYAIPGEAVIDFIRGQKSLATLSTDYPATTYPGLAFRNRAALLGDIVDGSPVVLGAQNFGYSALPGAEGSSYVNFVSSQAQRYSGGNEVVLVGANDGMVHALSGSSGKEIFAYVPKTVHSQLHLLTEPSYTHRFYINAQGTSADAFFNGWKKLYVSTLGEGGRGIFALNVTDPTPSTNPVLWEKSSSDTTNSTGQQDLRYQELGYIKHQANVVRLNNGQWGVVVGNGYNSASERAQLFILNAENGDIIRVFDTQAGGPANSNGMSAPRVLDEDGDRIIDTIYAGDLNGNLWKIDVSAANENNWDFAFTSGTTPEPLFTAISPQNQPQSITTRPSLAFHPQGGYMLLFGTGKFIEPKDATVSPNSVTNSFYGLRDNGAKIASSRNTLVQQTLSTIPAANGIGELRNVSSNIVDYTAFQGWYMDFDIVAGERVINEANVLSDDVEFSTINPENTPCGAAGSTFLMGVNILNGAPSQGAIFDFNNDGVIDKTDDALNASGKKLDRLVPGGFGINRTDNGGKLSGVDDQGKLIEELIKLGDTLQGRTSWRQIQ